MADSDFIPRCLVPNELVSLEHEICELEADAIQVQTPTGLSRLVNEIRTGVAWPDSVASQRLIHPRGEFVGVLILQRIRLTSQSLVPTGRARWGP